MNNEPEIYIHAINPGFTIDGQSNVGELIELARTNPDNHTPISLAGIILGYTNSSGNTTALIEFPDDSWMTGEIILLRLASSPNSELADLTYAKTLAQKAGPLTLSRGDEILDSVCWTGKDDCAEPFKSSKPTTLIHQLKLLSSDDPPGEPPTDLIEFDYVHLENYEPPFTIEAPNISVIEEVKEEEKLQDEPESEEILNDSSAYESSEKPENETPEEQKENDSCINLRFSEVLAYYETSQSEQFIELYNPTSEQILADNCQIKYKNKTYPLEGIVGPDEYMVRLLYDFSLTKNPTTKNSIELVDKTGQSVAELTYYNGQKKATAYALIGYDEKGDALWKNTYNPTPGTGNIYQQYKTCEEGKVLNEETGNCIKPTVENETKCKDGYYLNPETGRCKKIPVEETIKKCQEGYYLNPETNRCKKIVENTGADYPLEYQNDTEAVSTSAFTALGSVIALIVLAVAFAMFEFRKEIKKITQKVFHRVFHRNKEGKISGQAP